MTNTTTEAVERWDGDPCGCAICADRDATLCRGGDPICGDCNTQKEMEALTAERDALREELAAEKALADRLYVQSGGAWDAYRKARGL